MANSIYYVLNKSTHTTPSMLPLTVGNARSMVAVGETEDGSSELTENQIKLMELAKILKDLSRTAEQLAIADTASANIRDEKVVANVIDLCGTYRRTHKKPIFFGKELYEIIIQIYNLSIKVYGEERPSSSDTSGAKQEILTFDDEFVDPSPSDLADFSRGLLEDEITPENIILPDDGYVIKREGMPAVKTSETFTDEDGILPKEFLKSSQALGPEEDKDKLFLRMPCLEDILQGKTTKDCYLLGVLQTIVNKDPKIILRMMRDNGNGTVTVRLFDEQGNPHYYIIAKMLCQGFAMNCMWVQMVERAFLIHRRLFPSSRDLKNRRIFHNTRIDIQSGFEQDALRSILDILESDLETISLQSKVKIILDQKNGLAVIGANEGATNWRCCIAHCYAILGHIKSRTGFYILVTEPHRGSGFEELTGVNYDPRAKSLQKPPPECKGKERMWLRVNDFTTPEELEYIIDVFDAEGSPFKHLEEKG